MLRAVFIILVVATVIGAMMPADMGRPVASGSSSDHSVLVEEQADDLELSEASSDGSIELEREDDGHFYANVEINGRPVRFVVDTGASGIALSQDDARRAGIAFSPGEFTTVGRGASGEVRGAGVAIDRARLGHKSAEDLRGVVLEGGEESLLGQDFLSRFDSVEIRGDTMTLR